MQNLECLADLQQTEYFLQCVFLYYTVALLLVSVTAHRHALGLTPFLSLPSHHTMNWVIPASTQVDIPLWVRGVGSSPQKLCGVSMGSHSDKLQMETVQEGQNQRKLGVAMPLLYFWQEGGCGVGIVLKSFWPFSSPQPRSSLPLPCPLAQPIHVEPTWGCILCALSYSLLLPREELLSQVQCQQD